MFDRGDVLFYFRITLTVLQLSRHFPVAFVFAEPLSCELVFNTVANVSGSEVAHDIAAAQPEPRIIC